MPAVCSICSHIDRQAIDEALIGAVPYRDISKRHAVTPSALTRHRKAHLSPAIVAVAVERGVSLTDRVEALYSRADAILAAAESGGQGTLSLAAIRELRSLCELLGRLSGELDDRPTVQVLNVQASADWVALRTLIMTALAAHPAARDDVARALAAVPRGTS